MIKTRTQYQLRIIQVIINGENHPMNWTEETLSNITDGEVVIGYLFKMKKSKFNTYAHILNLYTINEKYLKSPDVIIGLNTIQEVFLNWLESTMEDTNRIAFKNPPIAEWIETKENWAKKLANKLSTKYDRPYDDCLSTVYNAIMKCYTKEHVYIGTLNYIERVAHNDILMDIRYMKNRLYGGNPLVVSLDSVINENGEGDDNSHSYHELVGKMDKFHEEQDYEDLKQDIIKDMKPIFSEREIEQIINAPGYLTNTTYRKLLRWRKSHKRKDYTNDQR